MKCIAQRIQSFVGLSLRPYFGEMPCTLDCIYLIRYVTRMVEPAIQAKLDRMTVLSALFKAQEDAPEPLCVEYRKLQSELVPMFLPVIRSLSRAGLLTVGVNIENEDDIQQYATVDGQAQDVFENGNIWIAAECDGGSLK